MFEVRACDCYCRNPWRSASVRFAPVPWGRGWVGDHVPGQGVMRREGKCLACPCQSPRPASLLLFPAPDLILSGGKCPSTSFHLRLSAFGSGHVSCRPWTQVPLIACPRWGSRRETSTLRVAGGRALCPPAGSHLLRAPVLSGTGRSLALGVVLGDR